MSWYYSCSGPVAPDRDVYYDLAKKLFGEEKLSTHPVPEYMEAGEVPRYVADSYFHNMKRKKRNCIFRPFLKKNPDQ